MDTSNNFDFDNDSIFKLDLEENAKNDALFAPIDNLCILVTGATGLIGHHIVATILLRNKIKKINTKVLAPVRNVRKAELMYGDDFSNSNVVFFKNDILDKIVWDGAIDFIIHGATTTVSKDFVEKPVQTINTSIIGATNILELAREKNVRKVVFLSSLEVYGIVDVENPSVRENDLGKIDILSPRSSYSEGKRMVECLNAAYCSQYQVPVVNARLSQTFGSGVSIDDTRVFAQFARSVITNNDIILQTDGGTCRNYCDVSDAVRGILLLLSHGVPGEAYNIANEQTYTSIMDMALLVAQKVAHGKINVKIQENDSKNNGYAPELKIKLLSEKIRSIGWQPQYGLEAMFQRLIESMTYRSSR